MGGADGLHAGNFSRIKLDYYQPGKKRTGAYHTGQAGPILHVMYSPLQNGADLPENTSVLWMRSSSWQDVPVDWDETGF